MATLPDEITPGQLVTAETMQKWTDAIKELQQSAAGNGPWITIPLFTANGWVSVHGSIPRPQYRRYAGQIQFQGAAYTASSAPVTGLRLSAPMADLATAVPTDPANALQIPAGTDRNANNIGMQLLIQADGGLYAMPSLTVAGVSIVLYGVSFADFAVR